MISTSSRLPAGPARPEPRNDVTDSTVTGLAPLFVSCTGAQYAALFQHRVDGLRRQTGVRILEDDPQLAPGSVDAFVVADIAEPAACDRFRISPSRPGSTASRCDDVYEGEANRLDAILPVRSSDPGPFSQGFLAGASRPNRTMPSSSTSIRSWMASSAQPSPVETMS